MKGGRGGRTTTATITTTTATITTTTATITVPATSTTTTTATSTKPFSTSSTLNTLNENLMKILSEGQKKAKNDTRKRKLKEKETIEEKRARQDKYIGKDGKDLFFKCYRCLGRFKTRNLENHFKNECITRKRKRDVTRGGRVEGGESEGGNDEGDIIVRKEKRKDDENEEKEKEKEKEKENEENKTLSEYKEEEERKEKN